MPHEVTPLVIPSGAKESILKDCRARSVVLLAKVC